MAAAPTGPGPTGLVVRPLVAADLPASAALNDAAVPAVNALGLDGLTAHATTCDLALVATDGEDVIGLLLALAPGAEYASENYRWFAAHVPGSLYVDRVVVAPHAHGRGVGRAFYEAVLGHAAALGAATVTCEVNLDPPNPGSLAFHDRLGFTQVGEQLTKGGTVRVALLARPLDGGHDDEGAGVGR